MRTNAFYFVLLLTIRRLNDCTRHEDFLGAAQGPELTGNLSLTIVRLYACFGTCIIYCVFPRSPRSLAKVVSNP